MDFIEFKKKHQEHMYSIFAQSEFLYKTAAEPDEMWELYLESFAPEHNKIYRERREHDCSCCKQFIRQFGNVVAIFGGKLATIWDISGCEEYQPSVDALRNYVSNCLVTKVYLPTEMNQGTDQSPERRDDDRVHIWDHFYMKVPMKFFPGNGVDVNAKTSEYTDTRNVFKRSLEEITQDAIETVLDLIAQKSLYKGDEWKTMLTQFLVYHKEYNSINTSGNQSIYLWQLAPKINMAVGRIKNTAVGTLLLDLSNGVEPDEAVRKYESVVAPTNYKRPKPIFTQKMVEQAKKKVEELGLSESLSRRFAIIDDIKVEDVRFANKDVVKISGNVFDDLKASASVNPKKFSKVETIGIQAFMNNVLPRCTSVELLFENKHQNNLCSLIAPVNQGSKSMFKWDNGFSWAYNGNITDSVKQRVAKAGGDVNGVLRFSIQWNEDGDNRNDFDAHCVEPNGNRICYQNKGRRHRSTGMLDVDIINPGKDVAVENIIYTKASAMPDGEYDFLVHNYTHRGGRSGFSAEIEFDGQIHEYRYDKELRQDERVPVATVEYKKGRGFRIVESLPSTVSSKEVWGLQTNQFQEVSVAMLSPNYWVGEEEGFGNKHYFFMLKKAVNDTNPNGFFNEFLRDEFRPHRKVFEALGSKMKVEDSQNQLSGLGFSSTQKNEVIAKVTGHITRTLKILF